MGCVKSRYSETDMENAYAFPSWCVINPTINVSDIDHVRESWRVCMSEQNPLYLERSKSDTKMTPLVFFYNRFYELLFRFVKCFLVYFQLSVRIIIN